MSRQLLYWVPATSFAGLIFYFSHQSFSYLPVGPPDYVAHFFEYAIFAATLVWGATLGFRSSFTPKQVLCIGVVAALYALSDEFHQSFVPNRDASLQDVVADVAGSLACLAVVYWIRKGKVRESIY